MAIAKRKWSWRSRSRPVTTARVAFIAGCGRSGTTILGKILERHPEVKFLDDRFDLWCEAFPVADIWGEFTAPVRGGSRVALTAADAAAPGADRFRAVLERERRGKAILVEKLPINNFRLPFLAALYPAAQLINIVRHGVEVAHSIARRAAAGKWHGADDRKWTLLVEYAREHNYDGLVERCTTPFLRGLLEWRMSVEAAETYFAAAPWARVLKLRYEELIQNPVEVARAMQTFLGLPPSEEMEHFASHEVRRLNPTAEPHEAPAGSEAIAGATLRMLGYWHRHDDASSGRQE